MIKTFKKAIAVILTFIFVVSISPLGVLADTQQSNLTSAKLDFLDYTYTRNGSNISKIYNSKVTSGNTTYNDCIIASGSHFSYAKINLAGYEEILQNPSTKVKFSIHTGGPFRTYLTYDFKVYLANDRADSYEKASLTHTLADEQFGLVNANRPVLYERTATTSLPRNTVIYSDASKDNLITVLNEGTDNSIVSMYIKNITSNTSYFRCDQEGTFIELLYDSEEIDDEEYVKSIAENFLWSEISSQNINALDGDIELPTRYRGADVTWTSDDESIVTSDGKVTFGKTSQSANLTATLSYKGIESEAAKIATKTFTVTTGFEKPLESPVIRTVNGKWDRSANKNSSYAPAVQQGSDLLHVSKGGGDNDRFGYGQYNLKGYEEILGNPGTKVTYKLRAGIGFGDNRAYNFKVQLFNDESDYDPATVTFNKAAELGLHGDGFYTMFEKTDTTGVRDYTSSAEIDTAALNSALRSGPTNSIVTYNVSTTNAKSTHYLVNTDDEGLIITYYASEIDDEGYFKDIKDEFEWDILTNDPQTALTNDLPTYFRGAKITWSADVSGVVSSDGKVTQYIDRENTVNLTANVEYKDYSFSETFNNVTVPKESLKSVVIPLKYGTYISGTANTKPQGIYDASYYTRYLYHTGLYSGGNDRLVFLSWDFSDVLAQLNAARSISINLKSVTKETQAGSGTKFSVLPDGYEAWTEEDLSYDIAVEKGLYTEPAVATVKCAPISPECELTSSAEILNAIRKSIADNPDDAIVNFRWEALGQAPAAYRLDNNNKNHFTITLYYYESELVSAKELANANVEAMPWSFVSNQQIDKVVSDLTLPTKFYGEAVSWESSDETVITSSGEVIAGNADASVILTATVNDLKKEFKVTVPANTNFVLDSKQADYVSATVWAKEACDSCVLVVATYIDNVLYAVDVRDTNFALAEGENFIWTKLDGTEPGEIVKVMLLSDMETITPLANAK